MIIVKIGGGKNINWNYIAKDIINISEKMVIVHGANAWMKETAEKLGVTERMILSPSGHTSRYTDEAAMEVLIMVYDGLINKKIVACLQKYKVNAVGLSGADGKLWLGTKKDAIFSKEGDKIKLVSDSLTGKVDKVNTSLIKLLLHGGYLPVITIPAITPDGELINVDNDRAVAVMARDLKVKKIVMLFEAPGLLENPKNEATKIPKITRNKLEFYIDKMEGRMRKKLLGVKEALSFGVKKIYFGDGRIKNPILKALKGEGTVIC